MSWYTCCVAGIRSLADALLQRMVTKPSAKLVVRGVCRRKEYAVARSKLLLLSRIANGVVCAVLPMTKPFNTMKVI